MRNLYFILAIVLTFSFTTKLNASIPEPILSLPTLPQQYLETRYQSIQQDFEQRATLFLKGRSHQVWSLNKPRADLVKEFDLIREWRYHTWYVDPMAKTLISRADFMVAQDLITKGLYRKPNSIAFQYNLTDNSYNASTLLLNGFKFIGLEAPTAANIQNFFLLLQNHRVTQLVRLSGPGENGTEKNNAYWTTRLNIDPKTKDSLLNVPQPNTSITYPVRYYAIDTWSEDKMIAPADLLKLIQKVQKNYDPNGIIACHSTDGSGRTGSFIAGYLLISEIDRQIASGTAKSALDISVEKIVMQLALQRPYLVENLEQYIGLYRLVDLYMASLK